MLIAWGALALVALPWLAGNLGLGAWMRRWALSPSGSPSTGSVCAVVPARDEAGAIGACVDALLATEVSRVVVVDDGSTDGTAEIARRRTDPRVEVVAAPERPGGWAGKAWAVHSGALGAVEDWLLFVDADVRVDPRAPATLIALATAESADLVSAFGTWEVRSLGERLLVPAFGWLIRGGVPIRAVNEGRAAFANGQLVLARRSAYLAAGGHEAHKGDVLDDVGLAIAIRASGGRIALRWAPWAFRLRPYTSGAEVVAGYRKNLYAGLGRRPWLALLGVAGLLGAYLGPLALVTLGLALADPLVAGAAAAVLALQIVLRARLELVDGRPPWIALLDPLSGLVMAGTLAASAFGGSARWKGRAFAEGRAVDSSRPPEA